MQQIDRSLGAHQVTGCKMSCSEHVSLWNEGVKKLLESDVTGALEDFKSIDSPTARIYFNMALAHKRLQKDELALQELSEALRLDPNFAVAYFMKGAYLFEQERYQEALDAFVEGRKKLFGRQFINYHQLGMMFVLSDEDFLNNILLCRQKVNPAADPVSQLVTLPTGLAFHPPKNKVESLEKINFLGKAMVIKVDNRCDPSVGYSGVKVVGSHQVTVNSAPTSPKSANQSLPHLNVRVLNQSSDLHVQLPPSHLRPPAASNQWASTSDIQPTRIAPAPPKNSKMGLIKDRHVVLPWIENKDKDISDDESDISPASSIIVRQSIHEELSVAETSKPQPPPRKKLESNDKHRQVDGGKPAQAETLLGSSINRNEQDAGQKEAGFCSWKNTVTEFGQNLVLSKPAVQDVVTVKFVCNINYQEQVERNRSLASMLSIASSACRVKENIFNIWYKTEDDQFEVIKSEADMSKWWQTTAESKQATLWLFGK